MAKAMATKTWDHEEAERINGLFQRPWEQLEMFEGQTEQPGSHISNTAMQFGRHSYGKVADEWFVEPRWCVEALADAEPFEGTVYDPAVGSGTIPQVFKDRGHATLASDTVDRGYPLDWQTDFLHLKVGQYFDIYTRADNIITNPPFSLAEEFAKRAITLAGSKVALLVSLTFLESQRRQPFFEQSHPRRVWVCSRRPSMPPGGSDLPARGGKRPYCWMVWEKGYKGPTELRWLK